MAEIRRTLQIAGVPETTGPWARAVAWNGLIFISGVRGIDPQTGRPAGDLRQRIALIFDHLDKILASEGSSRASVLVSRVYVTDMDRIRPLVNEAYVAAFGAALPTRSIIKVAGLNQGDDVEIEFIAAREDR